MFVVPLRGFGPWTHPFSSFIPILNFHQWKALSSICTKCPLPSPHQSQKNLPSHANIWSGHKDVLQNQHFAFTNWLIKKKIPDFITWDNSRCIRVAVLTTTHKAKWVHFQTFCWHPRHLSALWLECVVSSLNYKRLECVAADCKV